MSGLRGWIIFCLDCAADRHVRWRHASPTHQQGKRIDTGPGRLFPRRPRSRRCTDADVAVVPLILRPNVASAAGQTCGLLGHRHRHPCSIRRLLCSPDPEMGCAGYQTHSELRSHLGLRHRRADIRLDHGGLNAAQKTVDRLGSARRGSPRSVGGSALHSLLPTR
jgi:hypothetical protein